MPELIGREVTQLLLDTAIKQFGENWLQDKLTKNGLLIAKQIISKQPTIEAEPVRRGEWIQIGEKTMKCSVCGWYQSAKRTETVKSGCFAKAYHFCTACGARMDGGIEND